MLVMPSVDILAGKCVRLTKGSPDTAKVYYKNPIDAALRWQNEGAEAIHVIDLDAALGLGDNLDIITNLIKTVNAKVEVGGGIRSLDKAVELYSQGAERVILGSEAVKNPEIVSDLAQKIGSNHLMVSLDYKKDKVAVEGWKKVTRYNLFQMASTMERSGAGWILSTSVSRDGTFKGVDLKTIEKLVQSVKIRVVASGGVRNLDDILNLKKIGVSGVVIGKAFFEGTIDLKEAIKMGTK
ncbi:MAG: 1-(5-phosphoribosyl)-5-[(5-phosphoribosylamino)methylideneamino]imidazole-4-carboxamide isomerase [Candidatus Jordarchaeum sp.]|uniref:1-(5-phosphoribosyl)-5-[(5- phosphoribosylamino)methylideneamino]imidazole-4- carboxamide isomerase n=1 Tax=Candidatus Jordarchaeum sp. TaxID=2823881 RepID=UPI004049DCB0